MYSCFRSFFEHSAILSTPMHASTSASAARLGGQEGDDAAGVDDGKAAVGAVALATEELVTIQCMNEQGCRRSQRGHAVRILLQNPR